MIKNRGLRKEFYFFVLGLILSGVSLYAIIQGLLINNYVIHQGSKLEFISSIIIIVIPVIVGALFSWMLIKNNKVLALLLPIAVFFSDMIGIIPGGIKDLQQKGLVYLQMWLFISGIILFAKYLLIGLGYLFIRKKRPSSESFSQT